MFSPHICSFLYQSKGIYLFVLRIYLHKQRNIGRDTRADLGGGEK